jgi:hypothetical protein
MTAAQQNLEHLRVRARSAPLCYSRQAQSDGIEQARPDTLSSAALTVLGVATCAAAFLMGWLGLLI